MSDHSGDCCRSGGGLKDLSFSAIWSFVWSSMKIYWPYLMCMFQASVIMSFVVPICNYSLKMMIDTLTNQEVAGGSFLMSELYYSVALFIGCHIVLDFSWRLSHWATIHSIPQIRADLHRRAYNHVKGYSYRFFTEAPSGYVTAKIDGIQQGFKELFQLVHVFLSPRIGKILVATFLLYTVQPMLALCTSVWCVAFLYVNYLMALRMGRLASATSKKRHDMMGFVTDVISNMINVISFSRADIEEKKYHAKLESLKKADIRYKWYKLLVDVVQGALYLILTVGFLFMVVDYRKRGLITIGDFSFVFMSIFLIIEEVWNLMDHIDQFFTQYGDFKAAIEVLTHKYEVVDAEGAKELRVSDARIEFKNVSFAYNEKSNAVFENLSCTVHPGEKVGLIGLSGAGKSTMTKLLMRYYDVKSGVIEVDGQDISKVTQDSLRNNIDFGTSRYHSVPSICYGEYTLCKV